MKKEGKTLRILIVDDESLICMSISRFLKKNAVVKAVYTAEEALEEIKEQNYDLCFLDVIMPGMTGLEAMNIIKELSPNTKVAIMTATLLNEEMKRHVEENAYAFIEKPFTLSDIDSVAQRVTVALNQ